MKAKIKATGEIKRLPYQNIFCVRPLADNSIEYTRNDAFIEKAAEWVYDNAYLYVDGQIDIEDFKKYMEGE